MCLSNLMCIPVSLHACTALVFDSLSAHDSERAMAVSIKVANGEHQTKGPPSLFICCCHGITPRFLLPINQFQDVGSRICLELSMANLVTHRRFTPRPSITQCVDDAAVSLHADLTTEKVFKRSEDDVED